MKATNKTLKTKGRILGRRFAGLLVAFALLVTLLPTVAFAEANQAVNDASQGVVQVNLTYRDDDGNKVIIAQGSGFLINNDHVLTCAHVVTLDDRKRDGDEMSDLEAVAKLYNKKKSQVKDRLGYSVTINRDVYIAAKELVQISMDVDWAILSLSQAIQNKNPLAIRSSATVKQTETAYAIGFPGETAVFQDINTYTSDDVTITEGTINKISVGTNLWSGKNATYIQSSVKTTGGNSGGPLVDEEGNVIGICEGAIGTYFQDDYFHAVAIDQVTEVLDALGIRYTRSDGVAFTPTPVEKEEPVVTVVPEPEPEVITDPEPEAEPVDKTELASAIREYKGLEAKSYTEKSYSKLTEKLEKAQAVKDNETASERDVERALEELNKAADDLEKKPDMTMILIIAAGVVVMILVIVIVLIISSNKKSKPDERSGGGSGRISGFNAGTTSLTGSDDPTVLLKYGAGSTTLLSRGALVNSRTGERILINKEEFKIGRERTSVDYCIDGNSTIGRQHVKIVNRGGVAYLVDLNAKNGTFLNGVRCSPMQENPLKNGDKIVLSDMEFTYQI